MDRLSLNWLARLPVELHELVIPPARIESFHDDSVPASKWRGYDIAGELCYYHHSYTLWEQLFDDEDEPCLRQLEAESLEAWRCEDGTWLRRLIRHGAAGTCAGKPRGDSGFEQVGARDIPRF